jgi:hypothetical protein
MCMVPFALLLRPPVAPVDNTCDVQAKQPRLQAPSASTIRLGSETRGLPNR